MAQTAQKPPIPRRRSTPSITRSSSSCSATAAYRTSSSPSASAFRLRRARAACKALEDAGIIVRRVTILDRKKLGFSLTAIIQIAMDRHTPERFASFEKKLRACPEVQACYLVAGQDADYLLKVVLPDMDHYQEILAEQDHPHRGRERRALELRDAAGDRHDGAAAGLPRAQLKCACMRVQMVATAAHREQDHQ